MASPASVIAEYIITTLELMTRPTLNNDWPLYTSLLPDGKNVKTNAGVIYDIAGVSDSRQMNGLIPEHPGIQLRIRSRDYETGFAKIEAMASALDDLVTVATVIVGDETYEIYNVSRQINIIPSDEVKGTTRRYLFTLDFIVTIKKL